jgi:hypothetical protein
MHTLLVVLLVLWLLGALGGGHAMTGGGIHVLLVVILVLFIVDRRRGWGRL